MTQSIAAARLVNRPVLYLARDASPRRHTADYLLRGKRLRVTHGTEDTAIFQEIFTAGFYDFPSEWLAAPRTIVDLGGNIGMFALYATLRWPDAKLVGLEPDPVNAAKYRRMLNRNAIEGRLIEACAAAERGRAMFSFGHESTSHLTDDGSGINVACVDVFPYIDESDLLKVDIEGGEWEILMDERFRCVPARVILLEYHPHLCPADDARQLAMERLTMAGFTVRSVLHGRDGVGVVWAYRGEARSRS